MKEKVITPMNGFVMLPVLILLALSGFFLMLFFENPLLLAVTMLAIFCLKGFTLINPNTSKVFTLFGKYIGTVKENGFYWVNPFYVGRSFSLRARNFDSQRVKVNDKRGNPIQISAILVWRVQETYRAAFDVDNYQEFVKIQTESAVRHLAASYSYDNFDEDKIEITLRSSFKEVNLALEKEITERLSIAGIEVLEARIGYLAYAEEIASAMLKRQQAEAIVAARFKIVEGAVGMVELALQNLSKKQIIDLDEDKKASMVSNLMVVLCSDKEVTPVVNTGSLYQ